MATKSWAEIEPSPSIIAAIIYRMQMIEASCHAVEGGLTFIEHGENVLVI
jgi:hypothetical protein